MPGLDSAFFGDALAGLWSVRRHTLVLSFTLLPRSMVSTSGDTLTSRWPVRYHRQRALPLCSPTGRVQSGARPCLIFLIKERSYCPPTAADWLPGCTLTGYRLISCLLPGCLLTVANARTQGSTTFLRPIGRGRRAIAIRPVICFVLSVIDCGRTALLPPVAHDA